MSKKPQFYLDQNDVRLALLDLKNLGNNVTKKMVIRRALVVAGTPIKAMIEKNAFNALMDHGEIASSFRWRSGTIRKGFISMFIRSIPSAGGNLTKIFEDGTDDRYTTAGWWTGKIEGGIGKTTGSPINTKFIQRGFDATATMAGARILNEIKMQVTKVVNRSKKLNNGK